MWEARYKALEANGWVVECESPFEIRHTETGSTANGYAAQVIADSLVVPDLITVTIRDGKASVGSELHAVYYLVKDVLESRLVDEVVVHYGGFDQENVARLRTSELFDVPERVALLVDASR